MKRAVCLLTAVLVAVITLFCLSHALAVPEPEAKTAPPAASAPTLPNAVQTLTDALNAYIGALYKTDLDRNAWVRIEQNIGPQSEAMKNLAVSVQTLEALAKAQVAYAPPLEAPAK
jgi:hypothetical protein